MRKMFAAWMVAMPAGMYHSFRNQRPGKDRMKMAKSAKKYHPIACMSYQDALGTVDAHAVSEFTVIFLIESQRLITKNIHHRLGDHNEVLGDVLV